MQWENQILIFFTVSFRGINLKFYITKDIQINWKWFLSCLDQNTQINYLDLLITRTIIRASSNHVSRWLNIFNNAGDNKLKKQQHIYKIWFYHRTHNKKTTHKHYISNGLTCRHSLCVIVVIEQITLLLFV